MEILIYNPDQTSFEHLRTNDGNRTNSSQDCHRKTSSPSPPGPMLVWKVKCKLDLAQMIVNIDLGEGRRGGGGVVFNLQKEIRCPD